MAKKATLPKPAAAPTPARLPPPKPSLAAYEFPGGEAIASQEAGKPVRINVRGDNPLKLMGGSDRPEFNMVMLREVLATIATLASKESDGGAQRLSAAATAMAAFKPVDEVEGLLAAQAVAMHFGAMECFRQAIIGEQPFEVASKLRKDGTNLARGMTDMLDALDRKRGKGPQVVRVERVVVHEGGQAIVGNVQAGVAGPPPAPAIVQEQPGVTLDDIADVDPVPLPQSRREGV